jgi:S-formylglutathione hydrolase FrmB
MSQSPVISAISSASVIAATLLLMTTPSAAEDISTHRFEISVPAEAHSEPITGRVYVMISRTNEKEPRLQIGRTGVPFFGRDVEQLAPGTAAIVDESDLGSPVASLRDIPPGDYFVQAFVNIYSEFRRADGHVVWMHDDQWEGQHFNRSPGNLMSDVQQVHLDREKGYRISLEATNVIPPVEIPPDTQWVKRFKFKSKILSEFWGRPIYLGATLLFPKDYDRETIEYPVVYYQGHFSLRNPMRFKEGEEFYQEWIKDGFPRMVIVTFQDPTPYFDTSYSVNSVNVGPYGDAIMQELIPQVEKRFRIIRKPYARILTGGSTGGWESLAMMIFYPDFFGGTFSYSPDPVTFTNVEGINIYEDVNAFYKQHEWRRVPTPNTREIDGGIRLTSRQRNHFELASGTNGRSGQQLDIWSAVHGPIGEDGYFKPLFNKFSGEIDPQVAQYWKENYDLLHHLKKNWATLGPKLMGKIHVYCGDMDNFYLNVPVKELEAWMKTTSNPHYPGYFVYGDGKGHGYGREKGTEAKRIRQWAEFILRNKPEGTATPWWRY